MVRMNRATTQVYRSRPVSSTGSEMKLGQSGKGLGHDDDWQALSRYLYLARPADLGILPVKDATS